MNDPFPKSHCKSPLNDVVILRNTTSFANDDDRDDSTKLASFIRHRVRGCSLMVMKPLKTFKNVFAIVYLDLARLLFHLECSKYTEKCT